MSPFFFDYKDKNMTCFGVVNVSELKMSPGFCLRNLVTLAVGGADLILKAEEELNCCKEELNCCNYSQE